MKAVSQNLGIREMISFLLSKKGRRSWLYFCSTLRISSLAFSFIASISFWQPSMSSSAACVSSSKSRSSTGSSARAFFAAPRAPFSDIL